MRKIKIIEVPSELGAGTRGASLGIEALKVAALNANSDLFDNIPSETIQDENQLLYVPVKYPNAQRIKGIQILYDRVATMVKDTIDTGYFPIVLAGDHSTAGGSIAGVKMAHPDSRIGVVWIDAHADIHSPYTSPSGNVHGMPVATALGVDNKECGRYDLNQEVEDYWEKMKNMGNINPKIKPEDFVYIALRSFEKEEETLLKRLNIKAFTVSELRKAGVADLVKQTLNYLKDCDEFYVTFDVDSMDPSVSYGTGTPVENGLTLNEAEELVTSFVSNEKINCLEFTEINPTLDCENKMAEAALKVLSHAVQILSGEDYPDNR